MTSAIVHGDPGCFKTSSLISQYAIPALYSGRTVVTNIRGFNDIKRVEQVYKKKLPPEAKLIAVPFTRDGFRKMGTFFHWAPVGALILFDEIQRVYPTRLKNFSMFDCEPKRSTGFVDKHTGVEEDIATVEEAFDCHRHMNWDIYMSSTNIEKVHKELRQVAEFGYRQKGYATVSPFIAKLLGDFKRVKHNAENKGNSEAQALVSTSHRIDKRAFACYESTATGEAKNTDTKTNLFAQPKLLLVFGILAFVVYYYTNNYITHGTVIPFNADAHTVDSKHSTDSILPKTSTENIQLHNQSDFVQSRAVPADGLSVRTSDQLIGRNLVQSITGWTATISRSGFKTVHMFEFKRGNKYLSIDSNELKKLGYSVDTFRNFVVIHSGDFSHFVYPAQHDSSDNESLAFNSPKPPLFN